jgi:hypothetical protein
MMKRLSPCLLFTLTVLLCADAPALAQTKPALSVKTRLVDASVAMDERLKA